MVGIRGSILRNITEEEKPMLKSSKRSKKTKNMTKYKSSNTTQAYNQKNP